MTQPQISLPPALFAAAFPFHFACDSHLIVRQVGASLARLCPGLAPGVALPDYLRIEHPAMPLSAATLGQNTGQLFVFALRCREVRLRGQIILTPAPEPGMDELMVFLGSPWLTEPGEMGRLGLTLTDFALHDPVTDLLQTVQSQAMALADTRKLTEKLTAQRAELRTANAALTAEIAERKAAEAELREREQTIYTLLEAASEAIVITDERGRIVLVNARAEQLFGYQRRELIGQPVEILLSDSLHAGHMHHRQQFLANPYVRPMGGGRVLTARSRDGAEIPLEISLSYVQTSAGMLVMAFMSDVSERVQLEQALEWARDQALAASRLKSDFLANMSHEIRTPLNAIIGVAELLGETPMAARQQELVGIIAEAGNSLLALISDILDISKIEAGSITLEERAFDLRACLESTLDVVATKALAKNLELAYLIEAPTPQWLRGDEGRLRQVLLNLVGNAVKFTDQGAVTVIVTPQWSQGQLFELHFAVHDTGPGIPPERQDRLFRTFSQLDGSTTRKYGGTGLGLAISRRLVEAMGGQMWMESSGIAGLGATFHFTVPYVAGGSSADNLASSPSPLADKRILLITGDVGTAVQWRNTVLLLEEWGAEPLVCSTLANAQDWLRAGNQVDAALADERLFHTEACPWPDAASPNPRLVLISAVGQPSGVDWVQPVGRVTRPLHANLLYETILAALAPTPHVRQPVPPPTLFDPTLAERLPLRILVVEDNQVNQVVIRRVFERLGYTIVTAASGQEGISAVLSQPFDLVFMDMQMPEMDGLEATRRIRHMEAMNLLPVANVRIVALTANALQDDRAACIAAGMDDYVTKPVQVAELRRILEFFVNN